MRVTASRTRRHAAVPATLAAALLSLAIVVLPAAAAVNPDPDVLGVYFDTQGDSVSVYAPAFSQVVAYVVLTNPSDAGDLTGWECAITIDSPTAIVISTLAKGINYDQNSEYFVAIGRRDPLPTGNAVVLAWFDIIILDENPVPIYLQPRAGPTLPGVMAYAAGPDPGNVLPLARSIGDGTGAVAIINGRLDDMGELDIDVEPDTIGATWTIDGPEGFSASGSGDDHLTFLAGGVYTITWGEEPDWVGPQPNPVQVTVVSYEVTWVTGLYQRVPLLTSVTDVGNDQGRRLRLVWDRTPQDSPADTVRVTGYGVYRRQDANKAAGWDWLATVPAHGEDVYQYVAETLCDSTIAGGMCWTAFYIRAETDDPFTFFDSPVDSGYSVDNLVPASPSGLAVAFDVAGNALTWDENTEEDVVSYRIYRLDTGDCDADPGEVLATVAGTAWTDDDAAGTAWDWCYRVTAVDDAGNESPATVWDQTEISGTAAPELPSEFALRGNYPNPFNPRTKIRYDLPRDVVVRLCIYDVSGRLVRALVADEVRPAGFREETWEGRDNRGRQVAAGVYFYRLEAGGFQQTGRMALVK